MEKRFKIICTIGPESNKPEILEKLKSRGIDFFRINLSHTDEEDIEERILDLIDLGVPIILDTEGSQVRSGNNEEVELAEGSELRIYNKKIDCNSTKIFLKPISTIENLKKGDKLHLDFELTSIEVTDSSSLKEKGYITCKVIKGGPIGAKKGVHVEGSIALPSFSQKDKRAIELAKKYGIKTFTLSFIKNVNDVKEFKKYYPEATVYSKIERAEGLKNFEEIANISNGILIDRGDLSREVESEEIPFIKKKIIRYCKSIGKEVFVATNTLEGMANSLKHNQAEINDVANILLDGAAGIALTKETAVGKYPIETVDRLIKIMEKTSLFT